MIPISWCDVRISVWESGREITHHLEPLLHWGSALQVSGGGLDVVINLLLGKIDHVGREKRLALLLEVGLISVEKTIQPRQELLGAVIGVQDDWDTVCWGNGADVVGTSNATGDGGLLLAIGNTLLKHLLEWFMRYLILGIFTFPAKYAAPPWDICRMIGAFWSRAASRAATTVEEEVTFYLCQHVFVLITAIAVKTHDGGDGKVVLLSVVEKLQDIIANDDTGLAGEDVLATHVCEVVCCRLRLYDNKIFVGTRKSQLREKVLSWRKLLFCMMEQGRGRRLCADNLLIIAPLMVGVMTTYRAERATTLVIGHSHRNRKSAKDR